MSGAFHALCGEKWAIDPSWLPLLASIAQRGNLSAAGSDDVRKWVQRDHLAAAGQGAQKLAGAYRGFIVGRTGILPITGPIFPRANMLTDISGATSLTMLQNDHQLMLRSREVDDILLTVDSPGGAVSGVAATAHMIGRGAKVKPTHAFVTGSAASAAYWLTSSVSRISADRSAMLGCIGVIAAVPKQVEPDQDGVIDIEIVSSNAPNKRPDPQVDEGVRVIRQTLDDLEAIFISDVARGRGVTVAKVISEFGQGGVKVGSAAVKAGMADAIETQDMAMRMLQLQPGQRSSQRSAASGALPGTTQMQSNLRRLAELRRRG
jgi:ClpP class serine protease